MNFKMAAIMLVASTAVAATSSMASVIDFEDALTDNFDASQTHQGYEWNFNASGWFVGPHDTASCPSCTSNGTSNLVAAGGNASVTMTAVGGGSFSIYGLDAATANSTEINTLDILGTLSGAGGTISTSLAIDGSFDSYTLTGFVGLSSLVFTSRNSGSYNFGGFSIDNLSTTPLNGVPEPASLALLGIGLAGLGATRLRKTV